MTPFELVGEGLRVQDASSHQTLFDVFDAEMSSPHACCQAGGITVAAACDVWTSLCRVSDDAAWCGVRAVSDDGGEIKEMSGLSHLR